MTTCAPSLAIALFTMAHQVLWVQVVVMTLVLVIGYGFTGTNDYAGH